MTQTLRVLAVDIEGGHGGSSRSLLQLIRAVDLESVRLSLVTRHGGAIVRAYGDLGISVAVEPDMPRFTVLQRTSRNLVDLLRFFAIRWRKGAAFRSRLLQAVDRVDVVHLNHISLFWVAAWLREQRPDLPITLHIRTQPPENWAARWQTRIAIAACTDFVFITEMEQAHLSHLAGCPVRGQVIFNPVACPPEPVAREGEGIRALCLSNFSYARGIDRLVEIAVALEQLGDRSVTLHVAGDMHLTGELPDVLGLIARTGGTLSDYAEARGVGHRFVFHGHVSNPETLLAASDVLLKPTRENNPWGRDILEGLGYGLPVASVGTYDRFVEDGKTGLLQREFDADAVARWLIDLSQDRSKLGMLGAAARDRIMDLCDPAQQAARLVQFWQQAAGR